MKKQTRVIHPPEVSLPPDNRPVVAPIYQSVKFAFDDIDEAARSARGERPGFGYSRVSNPTLRQLELTLAALQGRDDCVVAASGVAAVNLSVLALCGEGDHVVIFAETYQPTRVMVRRILARFGVRHTMLSIEDLEGLARILATTPTRLVLFESPTNPMLKIADLPRVTALARQHGALTVLDNTFGGLHNHGDYEIDLYVHSLTKYANGHGDVMGGAAIGPAELIARIRPQLATLGATLDPHAAFLIQRGLKTYFLRRERQCANALRVAQFLEQQPVVRWVRYPGLPSHPEHTRAAAQMNDMGAVVTFELAADRASIKRFTQALALFPACSSLGSVDSLIVPPQHMTLAGLSEEERAWTGITPGTVRLAIGIEDIDDLLADLAHGFNALALA